jgi:hypothetical protein
MMDARNHKNIDSISNDAVSRHLQLLLKLPIKANA